MRYFFILLCCVIVLPTLAKKHEEDKQKTQTVVVQEKPKVSVQITIGQPAERVIVKEEPRRVYSHHDNHAYRNDREDDQGERCERHHPRFTDNEVYVVREYYKKVPPGQWKKHHKFRHEWRERIIVGRPIPRDVEYYEVPVELQEELPPLPRNYVRVMIGPGMVIKDVTTGFVVDAKFEF